MEVRSLCMPKMRVKYINITTLHFPIKIKMRVVKLKDLYMSSLYFLPTSKKGVINI